MNIKITHYVGNKQEQNDHVKWTLNTKDKNNMREQTTMKKIYNT